ncbi:alpha-L-rhamnosidase C-terminal domain-containing protein [Microbacterium sp. SS28]|uniref:alpha-L-rhamnosidase C-terminal domain-containing protein n=1 Tax=Microbacterium sp. SS28 TaxID=2919948 RepID=UPI001FAAC6C2|nr:alpha-L-rhamnosidase C-terminal domain-containing protein [Microbacterium sp. SS28]
MHPANQAAEATAEKLPADTDWRRYVLGPADPEVHPVAARSTAGDVAGVEDFLAGTGSLTLSFPAGGSAPSIVLDYGKEVAGVPWLDVAASMGDPVVRLSYSESAAWTGPDGDDHGSHNDSASRTRVERLTARGSGRLSSELIQGGQRYQRVALDTPGTVTIAAAGMRFVAYRATPTEYAGWFLSSSEQLNRVWYESAYTVQINQLPADTVPRAWQIEDGALNAKGGTLAVLKTGAHWTDITVTFETAIVERAVGWVVRAQDRGARGYLCTIRAGEGPDNATLELSYFDDGYEDRPQDTVRRYTVLAAQELAAPAIPGVWHCIRTDLVGGVLTVTLDGEAVGSFETTELPARDGALATGTVGFHHMWGTSRIHVEHARFRNLRITDSDGSVLYADALADPAALEAFVGDGVDSPDPLPVILDGGKRDRTVWSGDLLVQIPNVFYTTNAEDYVRGSIELLNAYQEPTGQSAARVPPLMPVTIAPQHGQTYSAAYSMHQVINVGLHHLHTGDADFVRAQWPAIERQLEFDRSLIDDRGLVITDESNGLDWDWYDGPKTGAVSAYNITCFQTLLHAAALASAIGDTDAAERLRTRAATLRDAVNMHLYDFERHLYVLSEHHRDAFAQDANALAVVSGITPDGHAVDVLEALETVLPRTPFGFSPFSDSAGFRTDISPYVSGAHLTALFEAGLTDRALALVDALWGHMSTAEVHAVGTAWELVATDGSPGFGATTSLAHGWASGAGVALSSYVLGVRPTAPGFREWVVAPQPGPLTWARGQVPTPFGPIVTSWMRDDDRLELNAEIPQGTSGTITVPLPPEGRATLSRSTAAGASTVSEPKSRGGDRATFRIVTGGHYTVVVS